jgi:hypothetical protein
MNFQGGSQIERIDFPWSFFQSHNCIILASVENDPDPDDPTEDETQIKPEIGEAIFCVRLLGKRRDFLVIT